METDGRDASVPFGLVGGEELAMAGREGSVSGSTPPPLSLTIGLHSNASKSAHRDARPERSSHLASMGIKASVGRRREMLLLY